MQGLALLGQQLLSDGGEGSLPADVLVAAARQHLMSATAMQLKLPHVALLLADYQQLAASYYAHTMLARYVKGLCILHVCNQRMLNVGGLLRRPFCCLQQQNC